MTPQPLPLPPHALGGSAGIPRRGERRCWYHHGRSLFSSDRGTAPSTVGSRCIRSDNGLRSRTSPDPNRAPVAGKAKAMSPSPARLFFVSVPPPTERVGQKHNALTDPPFAREGASARKLSSALAKPEA